MKTLASNISVNKFFTFNIFLVCSFVNTIFIIHFSFCFLFLYIFYFLQNIKTRLLILNFKKFCYVLFTLHFLYKYTNKLDLYLLLQRKQALFLLFQISFQNPFLLLVDVFQEKFPTFFHTYLHTIV